MPTTPQNPGPALQSRVVTVPAWLVRAIIPCHNRPDDLRTILGDLRDPSIVGEVRGGAELSVLVVDNASDPPLDEIVREARHAGLSVEVARSDENLGGSGGFNRGLTHWLSRGVEGDAREFLWLLDSDARPQPGCLAPLIEALDRDATLAVAGSALVDPASPTRIFELGGTIDARTGEYVQHTPSTGEAAPRRCRYVAACSMLVRRAAVEQAGLMSDVFLNGDDVEWCLRLERATEQGVAAVPASRVAHPHPDRMRTIARYYAARNCFPAIDSFSAGLSSGQRRRIRRRRAWREIARAAAQVMIGRDDLAALHVNGLRDAAAGVSTGAAPAGALQVRPLRPLAELPAAIRECLSAGRARGRAVLRRSALPDPAPVLRDLHRLCIDPLVLPADDPPAARTIVSRLLRAPRASVAVVSARARSGDWLLARTIISVVPPVGADPGGFHVAQVRRARTALNLLRLAIRGLSLSRAIARLPLPELAPLADVDPTPREANPARSRQPATAQPSPTKPAPTKPSSTKPAPTKPVAALEPKPVPRTSPVPTSRAGPSSSVGAPQPTLFDASPTPLTLAVIVLSHNRWPHLQRTLERLAEDPATRDAHIIVADNASLDGTPARVREQFPRVDLLALEHNRGVAAFNRAARRASEDLILLLDDDAWPEPGVLTKAIDLLSSRRDLAAITLHPRHPADGQSEWPFARALREDPALAEVGDRFPVMGCANLVRREAFERVGGYDEAFFLYRNDADLAMKLLACGWGVHFDPDWVAWHDTPFAQRKSRRWFELATRNWVWLCRRHGVGRTRASMILMGWLNAHRLARWSVPDHLAAFRGLRAGLRGAVPGTSHMNIAGDRRGRALADLQRLRLARRGA